MAHAKHHNILTGANKIENSDDFSHIISVRSDRVKSWLDKGYEVIESSDDSYLIGKKKIV